MKPTRKVSASDRSRVARENKNWTDFKLHPPVMKSRTQSVYRMPISSEPIWVKAKPGTTPVQSTTVTDDTVHADAMSDSEAEQEDSQEQQSRTTEDTNERELLISQRMRSSDQLTSHRDA